MPTLQRHDEIFVLDLGDGENRFTQEWMSSITEALDEVDAAEGPRALLTVATGKIWSNGLDLDWLTANLDRAGEYVAQIQDLFARTLSTSVPTVAVLQGHTFAAGALLALAHDACFMRVDRGYFCLPEVDLGIPFSPGMSALIQARLIHPTAHEAMTTGRRYGGAEALEARIMETLGGDEDWRAARFRGGPLEPGLPLLQPAQVLARIHEAERIVEFPQAARYASSSAVS